MCTTCTHSASTRAKKKAKARAKASIRVAGRAAGTKDGDDPGPQVLGTGADPDVPRGREQLPCHLPPTGGLNPREDGGADEMPYKKGLKKQRLPSGHPDRKVTPEIKIRWRVNFHVHMKRAGTLCRDSFSQLSLRVLRWRLQSAYVSLEVGTVGVPDETSVPEGIAVILCETSLLVATFEVLCQTCTSEDLSHAPHQ